MALSQEEIERIIRLEERVEQLRKDMIEVEGDIKNLKDKDHNAELSVQQNTLSVSKFERIFWALITAGIGYIIWTLQHGDVL